MNESDYEKAAREFEESGGIEKLKRMERLSSVLNEAKFGNVKTISWNEEVLEKHEWINLKEVKSINDYIYGEKSLEEIKENVLSDISCQIKEITDNYGSISQHGDFIIREKKGDCCLVYFKANFCNGINLSNYPKIQLLNKQAEEGDLTDEEELAYSETARKFYGSGEWVESIPQDEMWLGSSIW